MCIYIFLFLPITGVLRLKCETSRIKCACTINDVGLLNTPKDSFIDDDIICKNICLIFYNESVLPNTCLFLLLFKSISIQQYFGGIE